MGEKLNYLLDSCILMELMIGAFNKREVNFIQKAFKKIDIIYIDEDISKMAENLIIKYSKSHNLKIDDALIAATSIKMNVKLITYNLKDFKYIPDIQLYQFVTVN